MKIRSNMTIQTPLKKVVLQDYGHLKQEVFGSLIYLADKTSLGVSGDELYSTVVDIYSPQERIGTARILEAIVDKYDNLLKIKDFRIKIFEEDFITFCEKINTNEPHIIAGEFSINELFAGNFETAIWQLIERACKEPKHDNFAIIIYKKLN